MTKFIFALVSVVSISTAANAALCTSWGQPKTIGKIDVTALPEASGLAVSKAHKDRLYHINDRGNAPTVHVSGFGGKISQQFEVPIAGGSSSDTESLGYGPCGTETCLYVGDIGDNASSRTSISIGWLKELQMYPAKATLAGQVTLTYPDGAHNAEGFFVAPNGDVVVFTKNLVKGKKEKGEKKKQFAGPSGVYRLKAADLSKKSATLEKLGEIDVPHLLGDPARESIVTGASVSNDGRILLLTYNAALEIAWDPKDQLKASAQMKRGTDFNVIPLSLPQQEAIEFLPDGKGFIATSEQGSSDTPIVEVKCAP